MDTIIYRDDVDQRKHFYDCVQNVDGVTVKV